MIWPDGDVAHAHDIDTRRDLYRNVVVLFLLLVALGGEKAAPLVDLALIVQGNR